MQKPRRLGLARFLLLQFLLSSSLDRGGGAHARAALLGGRSLSSCWSFFLFFLSLSRINNKRDVFFFAALLDFVRVHNARRRSRDDVRARGGRAEARRNGVEVREEDPVPRLPVRRGVLVFLDDHRRLEQTPHQRRGVREPDIRLIGRHDVRVRAVERVGALRNRESVGAEARLERVDASVCTGGII